jgi:hypothetical protein
MKKLNCSPEYKTGSTRNPATTKDPLQDPRCAQQNRESRRRQIQSDTFKDVYDDLKTKMQKFGCVKEDCWLQTLSYKEREYLDSVVFPPRRMG